MLKQHFNFFIKQIKQIKFQNFKKIKRLIKQTAYNRLTSRIHIQLIQKWISGYEQ
jgi:hypothetical protein